MRIKGKSNDKVSWYDFQFNLAKNNCLQRILELYQLEEVYLCIYGLNKHKALKSNWNFAEIKKLAWLSPSTISSDLALNINVSSLPVLFSIIEDDFDELLVWSAFTDWESFCKRQLEPAPFLTINKTSSVDLPLSFFLKFCPYKGNCVEIICDNALSNGVNKNSLINCLKK